MRADCPCTIIPPSPPPPGGDCADCLTGDQTPIDCASAPYPCNHAGSKVITKSSPSAYFTLLDHDPGLTNVHFEGDTLYWKINFMNGGDGTYVKIRYILKDGLRPNLSFMGTINICKRSMCFNKLPPAGYYCDPCTGAILPQNPEVTIPQNPEISL